MTEWSSEEAIGDSNENDYRLKAILIFLTNLNSFYNGVLKSNNEEMIDATLTSYVSVLLHFPRPLS